MHFYAQSTCTPSLNLSGVDVMPLGDLTWNDPSAKCTVRRQCFQGVAT